MKLCHLSCITKSFTLHHIFGLADRQNSPIGLEKASRTICRSTYNTKFWEWSLKDGLRWPQKRPFSEGLAPIRCYLSSWRHPFISHCAWILWRNRLLLIKARAIVNTNSNILSYTYLRAVPSQVCLKYTVVCSTLFVGTRSYWGRSVRREFSRKLRLQRGTNMTCNQFITQKTECSWGPSGLSVIETLTDSRQSSCRFPLLTQATPPSPDFVAHVFQNVAACYTLPIHGRYRFFNSVMWQKMNLFTIYTIQYCSASSAIWHV